MCKHCTNSRAKDCSADTFTDDDDDVLWIRAESFNRTFLVGQNYQHCGVLAELVGGVAWSLERRSLIGELSLIYA